MVLTKAVASSVQVIQEKNLPGSWECEPYVVPTSQYKI